MLTVQPLTLAAYLEYNDGHDTVFELVQGELVPMALGTGNHGRIAKFLESTFDQEIERLGRPWVARRMDVGIQSPRGTRWDTVRIPDVVVLPAGQWQEMSDREAVIYAHEEAPLLVVEVVSPSTQRTDYRAKRSEYGVLQIPEYWIVDPLSQTVTLCIWAEGWYDAVEYLGDEAIASPTFPELTLTPAPIFSSSP